MILNEINKNGLKIDALKRDMGWGIDFSLRVMFPEFLTSELLTEHNETTRTIAKYCANKLEFSMLTEAKELIEEMEKLGFEKPNKENGTFLSYGEKGKEKTAIIRPFVFGGKLTIDPYINFQGANTWGITLTPGHFSDLIITERTRGNQLFAYTKDFMTNHFPIASLYLLEFCQLCEEIILHKKKPVDFEEFSQYNFIRLNEKGIETTNAIMKEIEQRTSINKNKRIDTLIVNQKSIYDLIREYNVTSSFQIRGNTLLNVALDLGKTVFQVESFVKKYLDKKRVI